VSLLLLLLLLQQQQRLLVLVYQQIICGPRCLPGTSATVSRYSPVLVVSLLLTMVVYQQMRALKQPRPPRRTLQLTGSPWLLTNPPPQPEDSSSSSRSSNNVPH
jgi:hypothetical protein